MSKMGRIAGWPLAVIVLVAVLAACGQAVAPEPTATPPGAIAAGPASNRPPDVDNDAPAGECEGTANILSRVDLTPSALFRAVAFDNRVGNRDGNGIVVVRFVVIGDDLRFSTSEETAPYCILGGNEQDCGTWPRDEAGRYTWGVSGPVVQPGRYSAFVQVVSALPDSATGRDSCDWQFAFQITMPPTPDP